MCCFSRPVRSVTETTIFARLDGGGRQFVAYAMRLDAPEDLSMILPVPVAPASGEKAVEFISLQFYRSSRLARTFVNVPFAKGLVQPDLHVLRHSMRGQLKNEDVVVPVAVA